MRTSTPPCLIQRFQRPPNMSRLSCFEAVRRAGNQPRKQRFDTNILAQTNKPNPSKKGGSKLARTEFVLSFSGLVFQKFFRNLNFLVRNTSFGGKSFVFLQFCFLESVVHGSGSHRIAIDRGKRFVFDKLTNQPRLASLLLTRCALDRTQIVTRPSLWGTNHGISMNFI